MKDYGNTHFIAQVKGSEGIGRLSNSCFHCLRDAVTLSRLGDSKKGVLWLLDRVFSDCAQRQKFLLFTVK